MLHRSIFDLVRDFPRDEALGGEEKVLKCYLKPDFLIVDEMGMKQLPKRSGEYFFEIIMRRHENHSTIMTSNRPLADSLRGISPLCDRRSFGFLLYRHCGAYFMRLK